MLKCFASVHIRMNCSGDCGEIKSSWASGHSKRGASLRRDSPIQWGPFCHNDASIWHPCIAVDWMMQPGRTWQFGFLLLKHFFMIEFLHAYQHPCSHTSTHHDANPVQQHMEHPCNSHPAMLVSTHISTYPVQQCKEHPCNTIPAQTCIKLFRISTFSNHVWRCVCSYFVLRSLLQRACLTSWCQPHP